MDWKGSELKPGDLDKPTTQKNSKIGREVTPNHNNVQSIKADERAAKEAIENEAQEKVAFIAAVPSKETQEQGLVSIASSSFEPSSDVLRPTSPTSTSTAFASNKSKSPAPIDAPFVNLFEPAASGPTIAASNATAVPKADPANIAASAVSRVCLSFLPLDIYR